MSRERGPRLLHYEKDRTELLHRIVDVLATDTRFSAAWLTGSFGRGEQDSVSDLDLNVLTSESGAELLADITLRAGTTQARRALFEQFGDPLIIHENPFNAPPGSSFSVVLYRDRPYSVDWTLLDPGASRRQPDSLLLFDHIGTAVLPAPQPLSDSALADRVTERWAFFWMMALVAAKYWIRRDGVLVVVVLDQLHRIAAELQSLLAGESRRYRSASFLELPCSRSDQAASIDRLCRDVDALLPQIGACAGSNPESGLTHVETLMQSERGEDP